MLQLHGAVDILLAHVSSQSHLQLVICLEAAGICTHSLHVSPSLHGTEDCVNCFSDCGTSKNSCVWCVCVHIFIH